MKPALKFVIALAALLMVSSIGGYFYVRKLYEAPLNQLHVMGLPATSTFVWQAETTGNQVLAHAGLLVPVQVPGCSYTCYLQFDTGAPYSLLYAHSLSALQKQYPEVRLAYTAGRDTVNGFQFGFGNAQVVARSMRVLSHGSRQLPAPGSNDYFIIGTIGTDLLDGRVLSIDYQHRQMSLSAAVPDSLARRATFVPLTFDSRRVLITPNLEGKPQQLLFDSGASAFALLTSESVWQQMVTPNAPVQRVAVNSWGKTLTSFTAPTAALLGFGNQTVPLRSVTHIEGTSFFQNVLMRFSGMGGMLGNEAFVHQTIVLDVRGGRFGVVAPR